MPASSVAAGEPFSGQVHVRAQRWASEETGFAILECTAGASERLTLVGLIAHLEMNERVDVVGRWERHAEYGLQVRVDSAIPVPPTGAEAIVEYLRRVKHIGVKRAGTLLGRHGDSTLAVIDRDPVAAFRDIGLTPGRAEAAAASWDALRATRELHLLLAPHGLAYLVGRIHKELGDGAHRVVRADPYGLTSVFGVGFALADRIARGLGVAADDPARARAAVLHSLSEAERDGSTYLPAGELLPRAGELLGPDGAALLGPDVIVDLSERDEVVAYEGQRVYRKWTAAMESELASRVVALLGSQPGPRVREIRASPSDAPGHGTTLTDEQWAGVQAAFASRLSIITGGPGTGKTATIKTIVGLAVDHGRKVILAAPTGRAAVRMTEATGVEATTVHSALGWIPGEGPSHDEDDPLSCDVLVIDETSMANLELLVTLLRAVGDATNVVLVGDADQLAPVGAGKPFADLVATAAVPTARLEHIFRQAAGSMIVQGAHAVRRGQPPSFVHAEGMQRDLFFMGADDPVAARRLIVDLVSSRLPAHYDVDPVDDIQVFAPVYRGEVGIDALNRDLREALNPDGAKVAGRLRIGDKLMLSGRNLHELGLMNGTLMRLLQEADSSRSDDEDDDIALMVRADEAIVEVPSEEIGHLQLAYACSVHKGQGIELPIAIIVAHAAAGGWSFLRREMLYTAMTRARLATVVVGQHRIIERAVRVADTIRRHSGLPERIAAASG